MPPHHPIFGHILLTAKIIRKLPKDAHGHYIADQIRRQFPYLDSFFYLDSWPFSPPVLVVISPHAMSQFTQENVTLQKHKLMRQFLRPLTGKHDLVSMEGQLWKKWRTIFNPGFSATHLATMVPGIMEDVLVFRDILRQRAEQGNIFSLEETTLNVTFDVIGRVTLLVLESNR
jgi:cytochrome P450